MMINTDVVVEDSRLVSLILDFLSSRNFHSTMRSLEKESGVVNCTFSENILFLRGLVLDGEWEAILTFSRPFEDIEDFDSKQFRYLVLKQKFMEVLYFKSGFGEGSKSYSIEDLIKCLNQLEQDCPSKTEYSKLCWLLTVPDLPEQPEYRDWNPTTARIKCFEQILELFSRVPKEKKTSNEECYPTKDRLLHLVIKGLCFESCVEYCHLRAINGSLSEDLYFHITGNILAGPSLESSGNFLSWLRNLSQDAFVTPFEPLTLEVDLKQRKQVKSAMFRKSAKSDDAEILSRSLSLSGKLAMSDIASHLCSSETGRKSTGNPSTRLQTATQSTVSQSHHEFLYKGTPAKVRSSTVSNGFDNGNNRELESEHKDVWKNCGSLENLNKAVVDHIHPSQHIVDGVYSTERCSSPQPVHVLKGEQQQYVLKQLEDHEKQKLELHEQLMGHLANDASSKKANRGDTVLTDKMYPGSRASAQNLQSEHLTNDGQLQRSQVFSHNTPLSDTTKQPDKFKELKQDFTHLDQENLNPSQMVSAVSPHHSTSGCQHHGQRIGLHNLNSFLVNEDMASTPVAQTKHKPEKLNIHEAVEDNNALSTIPVTPAEQIFPLTPAANGGVGHWVALSDGSGILNTSTPKAKRQIMSSTPAPPASPVLSVDGSTPSDLPLGPREGKSNMVAHYCTKGEYPQLTSGVDSTKDKENHAAFIHQPPIKHGPKVNGVRRALAPQGGTKQRPITDEDNRGTITPTQGPSGNVKVKSSALGSKSPALSRAHIHTQYLSQEFRETVQEKADLMGPQVKNGATFLVDEGAIENYPPPRGVVEGEIQRGGTVSVHKDNTGEGTKGKLLPRNAETANMTYRKPSSTTPPNDTTVTINHGNSAPLLDKQRDVLHSSSDIKFCTVATLEDVQAVRAVSFHPSGDLFAIGSNSKTLRVCSSEGLNALQRLERKATDQPPQPTILFKSNRHHRGSIYCVAWSPAGDIIATGSNDKSIKLTRFDVETCTPTWPGMELAIHSATVRDLAFVSRASGTPVLISGGAGDGYILISDCGSGQTVGQLKGHSAHIMTVYAASDEIIASGSADNTVRLWDLRSQRCIDAIATGDSCVASVCVNPAGNMLASGHEDGSCMIYDITAGRTLELFKPHTMDCRSVRFSPDNNFLLTGSYDTSIIMMDVRKDLETGMPSYSVVARHRDKVIQCRWHPHLPAFLSSSADKTASLWALDY